MALRKVAAMRQLMIRAVILSLVGPITASSLGPLYYGYERAPYSIVIIWALTCAAIFSLWARALFAPAFNTGDALWFKSTLTGTIMAVVVVGFIAANSAVFLLMLAISN